MRTRLRIQRPLVLCGMVSVGILSFGILGCGDSTTRTGDGSTKNSDEKAELRPSEPIPVAPAVKPADSEIDPPVDDPHDESLTSDEYLRLGLPAHDRTWAGNDMAKATAVLSRLAEENHRSLPRFRSPRSGKYFARMISPDNLALAADQSLPLETRMPQAIAQLQAVTNFMRLYLAGFVKQDVRDCELVELMGASYRVSVVALGAVDEFLPTIRKDDPTYEVRMNGVKRMKGGLAEMVFGGLQTLTERESYRTSELLRLVAHMKKSFPEIVPRLPDSSRTEALLKLEDMLKDPRLEDLRPQLAELLALVKSP